MKEYLEEQMSHIKEIIKEFNEMLSIHQKISKKRKGVYRQIDGKCAFKNGQHLYNGVRYRL